jgi:16S rRNA (cytidine1402-2'-O)-methyltransferase
MESMSQDEMKLKTGLYLVATPIGNLGDITLRARDVLHQCDRILAEDTRRTLRLLSALGISKPLISLHGHNEEGRFKKVLSCLENGEALALVTDAGMPTISDPGNYLVTEVVRHDFHVEALPGPSAVTTALAVSGFACDRFIFEGFLPRKPGKAKKVIKSWLDDRRTVVVYESPHRIAKTLVALLGILGPRSVVLCRELTKTYEEIIRSNLADLTPLAAKREWKGEITLVIEGAQKSKKTGSEKADFMG